MAEHLFQDDSQMLDRSSRYNPTNQANGMILNKGSHPLKHDRSSPRYVVVLRTAFRRLRTTSNQHSKKPNWTNLQWYDRAFHCTLQLDYTQTTLYLLSLLIICFCNILSKSALLLVIFNKLNISIYVSNLKNFCY